MHNNSLLKQEQRIKKTGSRLVMSVALVSGSIILAVPSAMSASTWSETCQ